MKHVYTAACVILLASMAASTAIAKEPFNKKNLVTVFNSGFEEGTSIKTPAKGADKITGEDHSFKSNNNWDSTFRKGNMFKYLDIQYEGGDTTMRYARIVPDPVNPNNKVLKFWLYKPNVAVNYTRGVGHPKARIQASIGATGEASELYHSVRMYLHPDMELLTKYPKYIGWFTVSEWWNNPPGRGNEYIFRITINVIKEEGENKPLRFGIGAQNFVYHPIEVTKAKGVSGKFTDRWRQKDKEFDIPIGKWMTLECYFKKGDENTGRVYITVTPDGSKKTVLFDIVGDTYGLGNPAPTGLVSISPMKMYTSGALIDYMRENGGAAQIYWDDFKIMVNKPAKK